jgi:hypothetical protein
LRIPLDFDVSRVMYFPEFPNSKLMLPEKKTVKDPPRKTCSHKYGSFRPQDPPFNASFSLLQPAPHYALHHKPNERLRELIHARATGPRIYELFGMHVRNKAEWDCLLLLPLVAGVATGPADRSNRSSERCEW